MHILYEGPIQSYVRILHVKILDLDFVQIYFNFIYFEYVKKLVMEAPPPQLEAHNIS